MPMNYNEYVKYAKYNEKILEDVLSEGLSPKFEFKVKWGFPVIEVKVTSQFFADFVFFIDLVESDYIITVLNKNTFVPVAISNSFIEFVVDTVLEESHNLLSVENYMS